MQESRLKKDRAVSFGWGLPRMRWSNVENMGLGPTIERMHRLGRSEREIASILSLSASSVHRHLAKRKNLRNTESMPNISELK